MGDERVIERDAEVRAIEKALQVAADTLDWMRWGASYSHDGIRRRQAQVRTAQKALGQIITRRRESRP